VHLEAAQPQILEFGRPGVNAFDLFERDPEFVFVGASGDFFMGVGFDIGVHADGNRGDLFESGSDAVNALEFGLALSVKRIHALSERKFDFGLVLAYTGEGALARVAPGGNDAS
jgi:hypothetical protein